MGAMALQGPHQGAQKSISTGASDFSTSCSKLASVTSMIPLDAITLSEKVAQMTSYHLAVQRLDAGGWGKSQSHSRAAGYPKPAAEGDLADQNQDPSVGFPQPDENGWGPTL